MRKLAVVAVCLFASLIGAAFIPTTMITVRDLPRVEPAIYPAIEYKYTVSLPEHLTAINDVQERKQHLVEILLPLILHANETVLQQRRLIEHMKLKLPYLTPQEKQTLISLAQMYLVEANSYEMMIEELLMRVDALPVSLVLAQAAIESGWGTSRFSLEGNNIFGLRTLSNYGMVPRGTGGQKDFTLCVFSDLQSCIDYYIWTINTKAQYEELRRIRSRHSPRYDSYALAKGLQNYSELGDEYVHMVEHLIGCNSLKSYDEYRLQ